MITVNAVIARCTGWNMAVVALASFALSSHVLAQDGNAQDQDDVSVLRLETGSRSNDIVLRLPEAFQGGISQKRAEQRKAVVEAQRDAKRLELEALQLEREIERERREAEQARQLARFTAIPTPVPQPVQRAVDAGSERDERDEELERLRAAAAAAAVQQQSWQATEEPLQVPLESIQLVAWRSDTARPNALIRSTVRPEYQQQVVRSGKFLGANVEVTETAVTVEYGGRQIVISP